MRTRDLTPDDARELTELYGSTNGGKRESVEDVRTALAEIEVAVGVERLVRMNFFFFFFF